MGILKKYPAISLGVLITLIFLALGFVRVEFLDSLELKLYDIRMEKLGSQNKLTGSDKIVIVDIDDDSVEKLGQWPWPRSRIAKGIEKISKADPAIIGLNIIYSEAEDSTTLDVLKDLAASAKEKQAESKDPPAFEELIQDIELAWSLLDHDKKLAESIRNSDKVVMPLFFKGSGEGNSKEARKKAKVLKGKNQSVNVDDPKNIGVKEAYEAKMPIPAFFEAAKGIGHVNISNDIDGKVRRQQILYSFQGLHIPSFALRLAVLSYNLPVNDIDAVLGSSVKAHTLNIPMNSESEILIGFKGPPGSFKRYSFFDVINDKINSDVFKDKIVLITPSASGIGLIVSTPVAEMTVGEFTANAIWAILHRRIIKQPPMDFIATVIMICIVGLVIIFVFPRLKAMVSGMAFILILIGLVAGSTSLFIAKDLWIQVTYPLCQLILGYIGVVSIKYFVTETKKEKIEGESAETNRMLGLSFQSQGQLDLAFDKLRKVPVDDEMKGILYNLALDYERKRQFNKAASVYEYIEEHDSGYKDVTQKKKKLLQASDTMVYGDGFLGGGTQGDGLLSGSEGVKPTLGRYEVIKQLGKGAMGVVYLGKDPRINRTTAIKTFRLGEDLDPDETRKLKEKFFREAESAGTLSHPHIVTIYDAGEEHDLAYIAMEFLEGDDLLKHTKRKSLLPMRKVLDHIADIADALDYAHLQGVVHRDIKPANIMLLKTGVVKITDFGIARITASSQTQTGVVKGTPHYMSPEQIAGEKVDGRSDLFSLGAMLFQMLTGQVPFRGDSPAALMHQIMNVPHPDPRTLNPKLLKPHVTIVDKALEKNRDKRYQKGSQMSAHLRMLGKKLDGITQKKNGSD
ncbi:MAG: CHASE2 domain-containing protein [Desulfobacterales bacterium]|nr:CHASE2 domain-containing protein [Desulfobacterales bacterium]